MTNLARFGRLVGALLLAALATLIVVGLVLATLKGNPLAAAFLSAVVFAALLMAWG